MWIYALVANTPMHRSLTEIKDGNAFPLYLYPDPNKKDFSIPTIPL